MDVVDVVDAKGGVDAAVGVKHTVAIEEVEAVEVAGSLLSALPSEGDSDTLLRFISFLVGDGFGDGALSTILNLGVANILVGD